MPALHPDVVLMDIRMPPSTASRQRRDSGAARTLSVLVLTTFGEDEVLWGAIEAGAAGFVLKDSSAEDLITAVRAVAGGAAWFDPAVAPRVLDRYRRVVAPAARDANRLDLLTDREHDVLRLMARGATNAEIARSLFVAEATVKTHVEASSASSTCATVPLQSSSPTTTAWSLRARRRDGSHPPQVGAELAPPGRCRSAPAG